MSGFTDYELARLSQAIYPKTVQTGCSEGVISFRYDHSLIKPLGVIDHMGLVSDYKTDTQVLVVERDGHWVFIFRGTKGIKDWKQSVKEVSWQNGWRDCWESVQHIEAAPTRYIWDVNKQSPQSITVTGHSLGGNIAMLAASDLVGRFSHVRSVVFGPAKFRPLLADKIFNSHVPIKIYRSPLDVVTYLASPRWEWPRQAEIKLVNKINTAVLWSGPWWNIFLAAIKSQHAAKHYADCLEES